jgi:hypothetical protein
MSSTKQRHCWSGMLAIGALVLSARAGMVRAGSSATPNGAGVYICCRSQL